MNYMPVVALLSLMYTGCAVSEQPASTSLSEDFIRAEMREIVYARCYRAVSTRQGALLSAQTGRAHSQQEVVDALFLLNRPLEGLGFMTIYNLVRGMDSRERREMYTAARLQCIQDLQ